MFSLPCCLIFVILYLDVFVIRDIEAGNRRPLFQKCKIAECPIFAVATFCLKMERMFLTSLFIFIYIRMSSKNLWRNFKR